MKANSLKSTLSRAITEFCTDTSSALYLPAMPDFGLRDKFKRAFNAAAAEARLLENGILHMKDADDATRENFRRDLTTCAAETSLMIAEDITAEVTFAVAALECGEKIAHTPHNKIKFRDLAADFCESITSSACAAAHAAVNLFHDVEKAGQQWEATHPEHHNRI